MRVVVTGARGQLGAAMVQEMASRHEVVALDRAGLDVFNEAAVLAVMTREQPEVIVNCTGYNVVDAAEDRPTDALAVNAMAVRALARAATEVGATFVHFSSDFVFDGCGSTPMTETDRPNPRSVYATSKLLGEWFALDTPRSYVLRVESLSGEVEGARPKGSVAGIVHGLRAGQVPKVFEDRTVSPTFVFDAARATRVLIERGHPPGIYHCVNTGHATSRRWDGRSMCGIAGLIREGRLPPSDGLSSMARAMAGTLVQRGPDDAGLWASPDGSIALAHRRLSIVDLSPWDAIRCPSMGGDCGSRSTVRSTTTVS